MAGLTWQRPPSALADDLDAYADRIAQAALDVGREIAALMESAAQAGAPWQDQTGDARRGLFGAAELAGELVTIYLSHGPSVPYGIHLETRWAERYAIIWPTIRDHVDQLWAMIAERLR